MKVRVVAATLLLATTSTFTIAVTDANAPLQLPRWFGDDMVLQTNSEYGARSFINGRANPGESVDVVVGKSSFPATADATGAWEVRKVIVVS